MPQLLNYLTKLKEECLAKGWIDTHITVNNLLADLEDKKLDFEGEGKPVEQQVYEAFSRTFPYIDEKQERNLGNLKFKFEVEHIEHVPTLFIHSKEPIDDETFAEIKADIYELVEESASFELHNPFMIIETHTYCVNLKYHMSSIYGILHKHLYGQYDKANDTKGKD